MVAPQSLPAQLIHTIGREVISGLLAANTVVTAEDLERRFLVSRTVVREAVKVLSAKGLVEARPKIGTVILDRPRWNLLDADVIAWHHDTGGYARLTSDLEEMRRVFEPWAARTAAERRTDSELGDLEVAYDLMAHRVAEGRVVAAVAEADVLFHQVLMAATQNEFMARLGQLFAPALRLRDVLTMAHSHDDTFLSLHQAVLDAVRGGRPEEAEHAMRKLLLASAHDSAAIARSGPLS
jgi:GntR family galactonate operon transcriptional repressor